MASLPVQLPDTQQRFVLAKRPAGNFREGEHLVFEAEAAMPRPGEGQVLVKNLYMSLDPALRPQMSVRTYVEPVAVGSVMRASTIGQVIVGAGPLKEGDLVMTNSFDVGGWQEYYAANAKEVRKVAVPPGMSPSALLGVLGITGLTAYFGLLRVGQPAAGETVVVSGAAGATGSVAAQIAKHVLGCRVVGIAGGAKKCSWLTQQLGLDAAIDYKAEEDLSKAIARECPKGVDVYFDNVGGEQLNACLRRMRRHGRVVMCGAISGYDQLGDKAAGAAEPGIPANVALSIVSSRLKLQGFIVMDYAQDWMTAIMELAGWVQEGKVKAAETVVEGLPKAAQAFRGLFEGANTGKLLVKIADPSLPLEQPRARL